MLASEKCKRISFYKATFLKACWRNCKAKQLSFKENLCLGRDSTLYLLCIFKFMVKIWSFWFFGIGFFLTEGICCTASGSFAQLTVVCGSLKNELDMKLYITNCREYRKELIFVGSSRFEFSKKWAWSSNSNFYRCSSDPIRPNIIFSVIRLTLAALYWTACMISS